MLIDANITRYIIANINMYLDLGSFEGSVIYTYSIWNQKFLIPNEYLLTNTSKKPTLLKWNIIDVILRIILASIKDFTIY